MKTELSFNNREEGFILPVEPQINEFSEMQHTSKLNIINLGEINLIGKRGLVRVSISSIFPGEKSPFKKSWMKTATEYLRLLRKWKESGKPIRVIIPEAELNMAMVIESFNYRMTPSGNINYSLELSEYRFLNVSSKKADNMKKVSKTTGLKERTNPQAKSKSYIVKPGDCLWEIARRTLGDGAKFSEIYKANQSLIDSRNANADTYTIYPGQELIIP